MINPERYVEMVSDFKIVDAIPQTIRVNTLKISDAELIKRLKARNVKLEKVKFLDHGYCAKADFALSSMQEYLEGLFYIQEAASQIPVEILDPKPGEVVLDMCSAPGSKTTHMAMLMGNDGQIIALDTHNQRLDVLQYNVERMGVKNVVSYKKDARFADDLGMQFDKILLDAPCSGNYTQGKDWLEKRTLSEFKEKAKVQKKMFAVALRLLKPKGILIYSTCSLEVEENEEVINWALNKYEGLKIIDLPKVGSAGLTSAFGQQYDLSLIKCIRMWPHRENAEGFFVCGLKKK